MTKLTPETLAEIRERPFKRRDGIAVVELTVDERSALLDHCTALEEELNRALGSRRVPELDNHHNALACAYCNGPLKEELKAAQGLIPLAAFNAHQIDEQVARSIMNLAVNSFRAQLVEAVRAHKMTSTAYRQELIQLISTFEAGE